MKQALATALVLASVVLVTVLSGCSNKTATLSPSPSSTPLATQILPLTPIPTPTPAPAPTATPVSIPSTISYNTSHFTFTTTQGSDPLSKTVNIWDSTGGILNWSLSPNAYWLSLSPSSGSYTGTVNTVTISVNPSGMKAGTYSANIIISATGSPAGVVNSPQILPVSLIINERSQDYGPIVKDIGTGNGLEYIYLSYGQRAEFSFHTSGSLVWYKVLDPSGNIILTGSGGDKVQDGSGSFAASGSGSYAIQFASSGILTPSVITLYYTVYG